jgi:hypothetical protein
LTLRLRIAALGRGARRIGIRTLDRGAQSRDARNIPGPVHEHDPPVGSILMKPREHLHRRGKRVPARVRNEHERLTWGNARALSGQLENAPLRPSRHDEEDESGRSPNGLRPDHGPA